MMQALRIKRNIKRRTPNVLLSLFRLVRRGLLQGRRDYDNRQHLERHIALNKNCEWNQIVLRPGLKLTISPESRNAFEHFCYRAEEMVKELDCFLDVAQSKRKLLDVGALHGIFSLAFTSGRSDAKSVAIDPSPLAFAKLLYNLSRNPLCNIKALELALSDREGTIQMYFEWEHLRALGSRSITDSLPVSVLARTGDAVCADEDFDPDVVKIDVEGYECKCLSGLQETLDANRPIVFLEIHPEMLLDHDNSPADISRFFAAHRYELFNLDKERIEVDEIDRLSHIRRVIAAPAERGL